MSSTTTLYTGLSGLNANSAYLNVIGNNVANVNTTAYKSNRMLFASAFSRTLSIGTPPSADTGGSNPTQVGLGTVIAGTQRNFGGGSLSPTGVKTDLAIEGDGMFVVDRGGSTYFTRAGSFGRNSSNQLTTIGGDILQGFGVDSDFNIIPGQLTDLSIPLGSLGPAQATRNADFAGNLNAAGTIGTTGTNIVFGALALITGPIGGPGGNALDPGSLLVDVVSSTAPTQLLFSAGQSILMSGAEKGGQTLPDARLDISAATTVQNFLDFLTGALGITTSGGANPNGQTPGAQLNPATGVVTVVGNTGTVNDLDLATSDLRLMNADGSSAGQPFTTTRPVQADGESVRTTFIVYNSLGTPVSVDVSMVLAGRSNQGTQWQYSIESEDDTDADLLVGSGVLSFDTSGQLIGPKSVSATIDQNNTGALSPLTFNLNFDSPAGRVTALADTPSALASTYQDGFPPGTLNDYAVGIDGIITGAFSNGTTRTLGQVVLAKFNNPEGLVDVGQNLYSVGPNSGTAVIAAPTTLGTGRIVGGSLELSNVDLSQEFINMIQASTGFSASSRVITTTDQLMQQLLVLGR
ncbi:MAG: flagellar hook-basal body complex protein [Phycisphaeraceae bacterium]|nr:flagellar hook-basal body complex protein [Phycisphaeraceae bacterium]